MKRPNSAGAIAAATLAVAGLTGSAIAATSGKLFYEAGKAAAPPYALVTVSHGKVTTVRWDMRQSCNGSPNGFNGEVTKLNTPIKHGRFSKTVHYTIGATALGTSTGRTTIKGTISGRHATLTINDQESIVSLGSCGSFHKFKATETSKFH